MPKRKLNRSLTETAYEEIKRRILDNEFPPGFHSLEQELADRLGMSRTPIREALNRLHAERLIEVTPRHGMRVLPMSPEDMNWIQQLLECLETKAAELIASRKLGTQQLGFLDEAVAEMESTLDRGDLDAWAAADERFHRVLLKECGNPRLAEMAFTLWDQAHRARMVTLRLRPELRQSNWDHRALVEAIRKRDSEAARQIHGQHLIRSHAEIIGVLHQHRLMLV